MSILEEEYPVEQFLVDLKPVRNKLHLKRFHKVSDTVYRTPINNNFSITVQTPEDEGNKYDVPAYRLSYTQYGYDNDSRLIGHAKSEESAHNLIRSFIESIIPLK